MADQSTETSTEATPVATETDVQHDADAPLGDAGKKALDAERRRANTAEKTLKSLQARIDEIEAEKLSKEERAVKERDDAFAELTAAKAEVLRFRIAAKFGITDEDAELFLTGTDEETITKQAERLADRTKSAAKDGLRVPVEGRSPSVPALNSDDLENALKRKLGINL
jgi:TolA-binding protein